MEALRTALVDVNLQINAILQEYREYEETTGSRLNAAQTRLKADQLRPLKARKKQVKNDKLSKIIHIPLYTHPGKRGTIF